MPCEEGRPAATLAARHYWSLVLLSREAQVLGRGQTFSLFTAFKKHLPTTTQADPEPALPAQLPSGAPGPAPTSLPERGPGNTSLVSGGRQRKRSQTLRATGGKSGDLSCNPGLLPVQKRLTLSELHLPPPENGNNNVYMVGTW